ncbi:MAG: DNA polymerase III, subunit gamma and tau [Elusimicrobia bacterium GWC2_64_44]|nr:MAG: DNA polymerase III, subunit gamma and tau [Elusimicrobia bacterium GWC2_64_44]
MSYENLGTKYRPGNLTEVLGQETVKTTLQNAVKLGRVAHSYVFYGQRGCGKTTIARILAKTLNCHKPKDGGPCGKCPSCTEIAESKSIDVIEIDAASNTGVDDVRGVIIDHVDFAPSRDKYKIYILDEVHMLSKGAFNALLKTVEEPPAHVVFIMATTEQNKVPPTILSRSQCFRFRPISEGDIVARLTEVTAAEKLKAEPEALRLIARSAGGAMRDALTMLDRAASFAHGDIKASVISELLGQPGGELINSMALALLGRDAAALHKAFDSLSADGYDPLAALRELRNLFAGAYLASQGFAGGEEIKGLPKDTQPLALARLARKLNVVIEEIKFSDSPALAAEVALYTLLEVPQDLDALVRKLEVLEARLGSGGDYTPPAPQTGAQKKNEIASPPPAAIRPAPGPAPAPVTASAAAPAAAPAEAWKRLLGQVSSSRPSLYNVLLSVRIVPEGADKLRLLTSNKFEVTMMETAKGELEETLARLAGRKLILQPEHAPQAAVESPADIPEAPMDAGDAETLVEPPDAAPSAARPTAQHAPKAVGAETEPELKHLTKVFHGRITKINKIK